eukprot:3507256-Rhodomonas_salina.1
MKCPRLCLPITGVLCRWFVRFSPSAAYRRVWEQRNVLGYGLMRAWKSTVKRSATGVFTLAGSLRKGLFRTLHPSVPRICFLCSVSVVVQVLTNCLLTQAGKADGRVPEHTILRPGFSSSSPE